ncbi:hypothetical protein BDV26DRAFT_256300 [Aspergillus bertholletiae]|uniref:Uncharacterized protein n=1 Tax=Aspergillus bertholletiae TaxID=1226010 RepID=A0A5N7BGW2_9EURO|nr:hypothetical protein BDV26DRAFT_256300 [Aspergillus bertholletiae]
MMLYFISYHFILLYSILFFLVLFSFVFRFPEVYGPVRLTIVLFRFTGYLKWEILDLRWKDAVAVRYVTLSQPMGVDTDRNKSGLL